MIEDEMAMHETNRWSPETVSTEEEPLYRSAFYSPVIIGINGGWSSFHYTKDGLLGGRVTEEDCTHFIKTTTEVFKK